MKKKNVKKQDTKQRQSRQEIESFVNKILGLKEDFDRYFIFLIKQFQPYPFATCCENHKKRRKNIVPPE